MSYVRRVDPAIRARACLYRRCTGIPAVDVQRRGGTTLRAVARGLRGPSGGVAGLGQRHPGYGRNVGGNSATDPRAVGSGEDVVLVIALKVDVGRVVSSHEPTPQKSLATDPHHDYVLRHATPGPISRRPQ